MNSLAPAFSIFALISFWIRNGLLAETMASKPLPPEFESVTDMVLAWPMKHEPKSNLSGSTSKHPGLGMILIEHGVGDEGALPVDLTLKKNRSSPASSEASCL